MGYIDSLVSKGEISEFKGSFISTYATTYKQPIDPSRIACMLGTIHSSKGREADTVILFDDITEKVLGNTITPLGLEDERRVFYVGMTRAKRKLVIVNHGIRSRAVYSFDLPERLEFN
jgi:superfamily I DNA/RNA helicase